MILHIYRRLGKHMTNLHIVLLYIKIIFKVDKIFSLSFNVKHSDLIEWLYREAEGYGRPEKHDEPIQHN